MVWTDLENGRVAKRSPQTTRQLVHSEKRRVWPPNDTRRRHRIPKTLRVSCVKETPGNLHRWTLRHNSYESGRRYFHIELTTSSGRYSCLHPSYLFTGTDGKTWSTVLCKQPTQPLNMLVRAKTEVHITVLLFRKNSRNKRGKYLYSVRGSRDRVYLNPELFFLKKLT